MSERSESWSRREFVGRLTLTGAASLVGTRAEHAAAEPPPETTKIRLVRIAGNREFVRRYPIATKRVVRAILKASDLCALEPAG